MGYKIRIDELVTPVTSDSKRGVKEYFKKNSSSSYRHWTMTVVLPLILFASLALISLRSILTDPGTLGLYQDWTVSPLPTLSDIFNSHATQIFDQEAGSRLYPSSWVFQLVQIPFTGLGGEVNSKGFLFFIFVLSGMGMYALGRGLRLSYPVSLMIGAIYVMSPIIFTRSISGYLAYLLAYALFPLLVLAYIKGVEDKRRRIGYALIGGLLFALMGAQIQFLVMGVFILAVLIIIDVKHWKQALTVGVIIFLVVAIVELPWVIPLLQNPNSAEVMSSQTFLAYHEMGPSPSLYDSMRMIGYNVHVYGYKLLGEAGVIPGWVFVLDLAFLLVAAMALLFRRDRYTIAMAILLVIGIFLAKGPSDPGGAFFIFLFENTPLVIFRELWHIVFIPLFAGTVLIGFALQSITNRFAQCHLIDRVASLRRARVHIPKYVPALFLTTLIVVTNGFPLLLGNMAGYTQSYELDDDYERLTGTLHGESDTYRIYWVPSIGPMAYNNSTLAGVDPIVENSPKPTYPSDTTIDRPLTQYNVWITTAFQHNETGQIGSLLDLTDTKYVILRYDFSSRFTNFSNVSGYPEQLAYWDVDLFAENLTSQDGLVLIGQEGNYVQFLNPGTPGFVYPQTFVLYGSADFDSLTHLSEVTNITNIAYLTRYNQNVGFEGAFLAKDDPLDIFAQMVGNGYYPGDYTSQLDPTIGWTKGRQWFWYDTSLAYTMNNGALSIGSHEMDMPLSVENGTELWAKVLMWDQGGTIDFKVNGQTIKSLNTLSSAHYMRWVNLGNLTAGGDTLLTLSSVDGSNYVDEVMAVSPADLQEASEILARSKVTYLLTNDGYTAGSINHTAVLSPLAPGSSVSRSLDIVKSSQYALWLNFTGNLTLTIADRTYRVDSNGQQLERLVIGELNASSYPLTITAVNASALGDIWLTSDVDSLTFQDALLGTKNTTVVVDYQGLSSTSWKATVNSTAPFMLTIAQPYDNGWVAYVNGQKVSSEPVYSILNGFWINQTGVVEISIVYVPQQEFQAGVDIAIVFMLASIGVIVIVFARARIIENEK